MLSAWHIIHLPVKINGRRQDRRLIESLVVSWEESRIEGFVLSPRLFSTWFLPADERSVRVTAMGVDVRHLAVLERRSRGWHRSVMREQARIRNRPVVDQWGRLHGRFKDVIFDEKSFRVTALVVSRGVVGDLLSGAVLVPIAEVTEIGAEAIKIYAPGEPFSMR